MERTHDKVVFSANYWIAFDTLKTLKKASALLPEGVVKRDLDFRILDLEVALLEGRNVIVRFLDDIDGAWSDAEILEIVKTNAPKLRMIVGLDKVNG
jgi:hypothetical protein